MGELLAQFEGQKYLNMETYRKTGEPVRTPVWFVQENGVLYVRTAISTGKFKRVRNNPAVRIAPCDIRGNVKGGWVSAEARVAPTEDADEAYRLLRKKYGMIYALTTAFLRGR
ncbi:MAG: PPOX class F420-dependent oxidoreductase, partial [Nitrososphaera sp.]